MNNRDRVLKHLISILPDEATNADIVRDTGIEPHQQVFQITQQLRSSGLISGRQRGRTWYFKASPEATLSGNIAGQKQKSREVQHMTPRKFEELARKVFSARFSQALESGSLADIPKEWDMLSEDGCIVGDAKYYSLVHGTDLPPAKFATIAEYIWLLEKTKADVKLLVFGNQIEVPEMWLERYGRLVKGVDFYFLSDDSCLQKYDRKSGFHVLMG